MRTVYSWARNGKNIAGATRATYRPVKGDVGLRLTCSAAIATSPGLLEFAARSASVRVSR